jgi:hypothetical protein
VWREREIHVIGLNLELAHAPFIAHCAAVLELRRQRIAAMGERLTRAGLPGAALAAEALAAAAPTRAHLARALCARGLAPRCKPAFDRWLKRGRPGYVARAMAGSDRARCSALRRAGAWRCWLIRTATRYPTACCASWSERVQGAGGAGLEVSLAGMARAMPIAPRRSRAASILPARSARISTSPGCHGVRWVASLSYRTG